MSWHAQHKVLNASSEQGIAQMRSTSTGFVLAEQESFMTQPLMAISVD